MRLGSMRSSSGNQSWRGLLENIVTVNFRAVLQCDAYAAYPAFANKREGIELAGCWAHARRHFHEAREHVPLRANWVLYQI
jgi:hypothetical protein